MARNPSTAPNQANPATSWEGSPFVELGATGLRAYSGYVREEWLRDLQGWRGIRMLREMRDNDPVIGAIFFAIEMLLRGVAFTVEPVGDTPEDIDAAEFVNSCLADMEQTWPELIAEVLGFLQFGWSVHEIVYKRRVGPTKDPRTDSRYDDGMIGWRKFAGRAQETLLHWVFDESGDATAMVQLLPTGGPLLTVPLAKCLHFRTVPVKNNPQGRSILRNAYTPYFRKKRIEEIEAIGIERDLCGVPVAKVPAKLLNRAASTDDKATLEAIKTIVRETTRNEQEGIVWPLAFDDKGNELFKLELLSTGGRRQIDTTAVIDRYDHRIAATVLADFITLGGGGGSSHGSFAQSKNKTDIFALAVVNYLDIIAAEFNRKAIPDLLALNGMPGQVRMQHGDISRRDLDELGNYVLHITQAGVLTPDAQIEAHLREEAGLPAQVGNASGELNQGATADENADVDGADTASPDPTARQGRGNNGDTSSGVDPRTQRRGA